MYYNVDVILLLILSSIFAMLLDL